ncbi:hypothetical protein OC25_23120 [Pedobacter kyungheensis]|uniref:Uncharacterized protein n=1 Tax=Pedobacter kyungheensis TaxID=1069985 RepID=A0A0C1FHB4_9SPHI|nr:hypothetical protein [Pedobacter kyungheensis]KIA91153.1 hypothetical protein OC25_23120 [Pedobacter kyungheensis]
MQIKKKYHFLVWLFIPLFLVSYFCFDLIWEKTWFFAIPLMGFLGMASIAFFILCITAKYKPGIFVGISVIAIIATTEIANSELFKSEKVLAATLMDDMSAIRLSLRENHTFEMVNSNIASEQVFTGNYKLNGNKIIFLDKHFDNDFIPDTLAILENKIVFQFNKDGMPDTSFARYFDIDKNRIKQIPNL